MEDLHLVIFANCDDNNAAHIDMNYSLLRTEFHIHKTQKINVET